MSKKVRLIAIDMFVTLLVVAVCGALGFAFGAIFPNVVEMRQFLKLEVFAVAFTVVALLAYFGLYKKIRDFKYSYSFSVLSVDTACFLLTD
ncbi:MAG: hypothetical protein J6W29_05490 [Neisseriaceae bacterium]|nr:hypothetical protein [Neisseriaceae bacterium]